MQVPDNMEKGNNHSAQIYPLINYIVSDFASFYFFLLIVALLFIIIV
jgi:hypothetical protein